MTIYTWVELNRLDSDTLSKIKDEAQIELHKVNQMRVQAINHILWIQSEMNKV